VVKVHLALNLIVFTSTYRLLKNINGKFTIYLLSTHSLFSGFFFTRKKRKRLDTNGSESDSRKRCLTAVAKVEWNDSLLPIDILGGQCVLPRCGYSFSVFYVAHDNKFWYKNKNDLWFLLKFRSFYISLKF